MCQMCEQDEAPSGSTALWALAVVIGLTACLVFGFLIGMEF